MFVQDLIDHLLRVDPDLKVYLEIGDHIDEVFSVSTDINDILLLRAKESMVDWRRKRAQKEARRS